MSSFLLLDVSTDLVSLPKSCLLFVFYPIPLLLFFTYFDICLPRELRGLLVFAHSNFETRSNYSFALPSNHWSFFIGRCLSIPAAMRCIIRKAQSVRLEELPVKASEELPLPLGTGQPATKLASLSLPPSSALFGAAVGTPSNPNTPVFLGTSPSFTAFTLETPSPTFSAFPFSSISPTFSFSTAEVAAAAVDSPSTATKQPEKKPDSTKTPNLKITLKRKRDDEYVIQNFQLPEEVPKSGGSLAGSQATSKNKDIVISDSIEGDNFSFDLATVSGTNFVMGTTFPDVTAGLDGSAVVSSGSASAGQHVAMASSDSLAAASGLGIVPTGIEGLPTAADLFDADGTDLEGILQNLSGASHLPPGIVSGGSALDFDTGLGMLKTLGGSGW